jgi:hypothetical protein
MKAVGAGDYDAASNELGTDIATNKEVMPSRQNRSTQRENIFKDRKYNRVSILSKKK